MLGKKFLKNHPRFAWWWKCLNTAFKLVTIMGLLFVIVIGVQFYKNYGKKIMYLQEEGKRLVKESNEDTFTKNIVSVVYDKDKNLIPIYTDRTKDGYVKYEDIPAYAVDAMIATEDRDFYEHKGVDLAANIKAVYELIRHKGEVTRGGSTITQQLARNIFLNNDVTWERKTEEIFISMELEEKYEKYQIMEFYLNNIYFANGYYGIEAASQGYFSKDIWDLNLSEIAFLCAIPNGPTKYDPLINMNDTLERRDRVLKQMQEFGKISSKEYDEAIKYKIVLNIKENEKGDISQYVISYVNYCTIRELMASEGFEFRNDFESESDRIQYESKYQEMYDKCQRDLYTKGYSIYTSIDFKKQALLQKAVDDNLKEFGQKQENGVYSLQASATCVDNNNGKVVAIVGGRSQEGIGYGLNRAYQSFRQPGSVIKPILVYATAFENGYTPESYVVDEKFDGGPKNATNKYMGKITLRTALEQSVNTVAWKLYRDLTPEKCLEKLVNMRFSKIGYDDTYLAASLGGVTYGASSVEMAAAYSALENDGIYRNATCVVQIVDRFGQPFTGDTTKTKVVYEKEAANTTCEVLKGVFTNGTAKGQGLKDVECAGKTGTTNEKKDGWFVGFTSEYTTAVWVGHDMPQVMDELKGNTYPLYIWREFMSKM